MKNTCREAQVVVPAEGIEEEREEESRIKKQHYWKSILFILLFRFTIICQRR